MKKLNYEYIKEDEVQYPDLMEMNDENEMIPARYRLAVDVADRGNPFIEALPICFESNEETAVSCYRSPKIEEILGPEAEIAQRIMQVSHLDESRMPLPYMNTLKTGIATAIIVSYRERYPKMRRASEAIEINDEVQKGNVTCVFCDEGKSGATGVALTGKSGAGKTTAKKIVLDSYPKHIVHNLENIGIVHQIPFLFANCPENSNLSRLMDKFGESLDEMLGNTNRYFEIQMSKERSLQDKVKKLESFIRCFSIGMLVIDEIQHMDFTRNKAGSYDVILTIADETGVGLFLIGQNEAYEKMFSNEKAVRRIGTRIDGDAYTLDRQFFNAMAYEMARFSWRDDGEHLLDPFEEGGRCLKQTEINALYAVTCGVVSLLVRIWKMIQRYGIRTGDWSQIDEDFLNELLKLNNENDYFSLNYVKLIEGRQIRDRIIRKSTILREEQAAEENQLRLKQRLQDEVKLIKSGDDKEVCSPKEEVAEVSTEQEKERKLLEGLRAYNKLKGSPWADYTIEKIIKQAMSYKMNKNKSDDDLLSYSIEKLNKKKSDRRSNDEKKKVRAPSSLLVDIGNKAVEESLKGQDE